MHVGSGLNTLHRCHGKLCLTNNATACSELSHAQPICWGMGNNPFISTNKFLARLWMRGTARGKDAICLWAHGPPRWGQLARGINAYKSSPTAQNIFQLMCLQSLSLCPVEMPNYTFIFVSGRRLWLHTSEIGSTIIQWSFWTILNEAFRNKCIVLNLSRSWEEFWYNVFGRQASQRIFWWLLA